MNRNSMNLVALATELTRQAEARRDFIAPTADLQLTPSKTLVVPGVSEFQVTDHTHSQIATFAGIPRKYYDKLKLEAPALLAQNVNHWFETTPSNRMIRTLDGKARAFLSDRYHRVDNDIIAQIALEELLSGDCRHSDIVSTSITEQRLYLQVKFPRIEGEVKRGDIVQGGILITNGEIGNGAISIRPLVYRLICENGMVRADRGHQEGSYRRNHIGRRITADENFQVYSQETLDADDTAIALKVRDTIRNFADGKWFADLMQKMQAAAQGETIRNPIPAVTELANRYGIRQQERDNILTQLIGNGDYTRWGLLNSVTAVANDHDNYDRAVELEELGGKVLDMPRDTWKSIIEAETETA